MANYTDVFSNELVPPAGYAYQTLVLTGATNPTYWPYNYTGTSIVISKIMDITAGAAAMLQLPDATQVSPGEDLLIFNTSAYTITIQSYTGSAVTTIATGTAKYLYLKENTTTAGTWGVVTYGTGTSAADASALAGYGLSALGGATLNQAFITTDKSALFTLDNTYRAKMVNATSGTWTLTLQTAATATSTFFFMLRNSGDGIITVEASGSELIDGQTTKILRAGESAIFICDGAAWHTIGYGRSVQGYTLLSQSVSAGGTIALTAAQALNQLINFTGSPAAAVTVTVPNTVGVWYLTNNSSQTVTFVNSSGGASLAIPADKTVTAVGDGSSIYNGNSIAGDETQKINHVVNPEFQVYQRRGYSSVNITTAVGGYLMCDRYYVSSGTAGTNRTISVIFSSDVANVPVSVGSYFRYQRNAGDTDTVHPEYFTQVLGGYEGTFFRGRTCTLSFYARAGSTCVTPYIYVLVASGSGTVQAVTGMLSGTWAAYTQCLSTSTYITTAWVRYSVTFTFPTSANQIGFSLSFVPSANATALANDYIDITAVQLEIGTSATPYIAKSELQTRLECMRYYEKSFIFSVGPAQNVGLNTNETRFNQVVGASTTQGVFTINYLVPKRINTLGTATITLYNPAAANAQIRNVTGGTDWSATTASNPTDTGFQISGTSPAGSAAGASAAIHWTADYEY